MCGVSELGQDGALAHAHQALFVGVGVVVAEEVEDTVHEQVRKLVFRVVGLLGGLAVCRLVGDDDFAEAAAVAGGDANGSPSSKGEGEHVGGVVFASEIAVECAGPGRRR